MCWFPFSTMCVCVSLCNFFSSFHFAVGWRFCADACQWAMILQYDTTFARLFVCLPFSHSLRFVCANCAYHYVHFNTQNLWVVSITISPSMHVDTFTPSSTQNICYFLFAAFFHFRLHNIFIFLFLSLFTRFFLHWKCPWIFILYFVRIDIFVFTFNRIRFICVDKAP